MQAAMSAGWWHGWKEALRVRLLTSRVREMQVVEQVVLGRNATLHLVEVRGRAYLVGVAAQAALTVVPLEGEAGQ
jgi:flagellar biogenesis protein FliO